MNDQITLGAAALMAALILATLLARWAVRPRPANNRPHTRPTTSQGGDL